MRDDDSYNAGYFSDSPSYNFRLGSNAYSGAVARENAERRNADYAAFEKSQQSMWGDNGAPRPPAKPGVTLYGLLVFIVFLCGGWFGFVIATRIGIIDGGALVASAVGAGLGWFSISRLKEPLVAILAVVETIIRWTIGLGIIVLLVYLFIR
jgi:hypothetical protein